MFTAATRNLFFTGKGGVGKTSLASATAVSLADSGRKVLLVSTDPASNLDEVLGVALDNTPREVPQAPGLFAMNINPEAAARAYREKIVGPYRDVMPQAALASIEEQFSGSCTVEIAAFDEFARLLGDPQSTAEYDHVVFDTAPTGHTLRLLSLPSAWTGFFAENTTGTSCLGPLAGLQAQQRLYQETVRTLGDPNKTTVVLVSRPEATALAEAERTRGELAALGIANLQLIVNGVFRASVASDAVAISMQRRAEAALAELPPGLAALPRTQVAMSHDALVGIEALRGMAAPAASNRTVKPERFLARAEFGATVALDSLVNDIAKAGRGVVLTMGKGGVGKTTVAAAIAVALAERGHAVNLSTTDPAAHLIATINGELPNLKVSRIDPRAEVAAYTDEVLAKAGAGLDESGRALLMEDLRSPCTEEIAVFRAFAEAVEAGRDEFVVLDTAPTGHTILLLDAAQAYHREVSRQSADMPPAVRDLLPRLRDSGFTRVLIITLPEATPVHEAASLQGDLRRAGIEPFAWIINQSLTLLEVTDPLLIARQQQEVRYIREVADEHTAKVAILPWQRRAPTGVEALKALTTLNQATACQAN